MNMKLVDSKNKYQTKTNTIEGRSFEYQFIKALGFHHHLAIL